MKNKKDIIILSSAEFAHSMVSVNRRKYWSMGKCWFIIFYGKRLVFHGKMLIFHGKMLVFHGKKVFHLNMLSIHGNMLVFHKSYAFFWGGNVSFRRVCSILCCHFAFVFHLFVYAFSLGYKIKRWIKLEILDFMNHFWRDYVVLKEKII